MHRINFLCLAIVFLFLSMPYFIAAQSARERSVELSATLLENPTRIQLGWTLDPSATGYKIYRKTLNATSWGQPISTLGANVTGFIDTNVAQGQAFEYAVFKKESELVQKTICVPSSTNLEFEISDMYGIGLCCNFGFGYYQVSSCGTPVAYGDQFGFGETSTFTVCNNGNNCEEVLITIAPDMFPNSTSWTLKDIQTGDLLGSSGEVGDFISERSKYGFIYAGIQVPALENRGRIMLLVEVSINNTLSTELERLELDLIKDGWRVLRQTAQKEEPVMAVRNRIQETYQQYSDLNTLFIIGHVPVPYSGNIYPDTHDENHQGAWSADVYYGELNGNWTDEVANISTAFFERNHNVPGDGRFDQDSIPSKVELAVGRVDFFNMPAFDVDEIELTKRYLEKDHLFRNGAITVQRRALVDDNFGNAFAAPAASAWRNFSTMFTAANIDELDYFSTMKNESYLWSYGCGSGSHLSAAGIGTTDDFAADSLLTVFTMLFGSQFGDWDNSNNFLKAPLASGLTLTNCWAGNPPWSFHHMTMGYPIGFSTIQTQNNEWYLNNGPQLVHAALMGDPSLRMHPFPSPEGLVITGQSSNVNLSWAAHTDAQVIGYYVYRATDLTGDFVRVSNLVAGTSFNDSPSTTGNYVYQVRAIKLEQTPSGTYLNPSPGAIASVDFIAATNDLQNLKKDVQLFPNPSNGALSFKFLEAPGAYEITVLDITGKSQWNQSGLSNELELSVKLPPLVDGLYIIKMKVGERVFVNQIVIQA